MHKALALKGISSREKKKDAPGSQQHLCKVRRQGGRALGTATALSSEEEPGHDGFVCILCILSEFQMSRK